MYKFIFQEISADGSIINETYHKTMMEIAKKYGLAYHVIFKMYKNEYEGKKIHKSIKLIIDKYRVIDNPNVGIITE